MEKHVEEWISPYIDHELSKEEIQMVESHLHTCPACWEKVEVLQELKLEIRRFYEEIETPPFIQDQVLISLFSKEKEKANNWPRILFAGFLGLFLLFIFSPVGIMFFALATSLVKIFASLLHVTIAIFTSSPYLLTFIATFALLLVGISMWSLRRLLMIKELV